MEQLSNHFVTGTRAEVVVNAPCGSSLVEDAVVARFDDGFASLVVLSPMHRRGGYLKEGTPVVVTIEGNDHFVGYQGIVCCRKEPPYIKLKIYERLPAVERRQHKRITAVLPVYCSIMRGAEPPQILYSGAKNNPGGITDISLSAGGFKVKTPFQLGPGDRALVVLPGLDSMERPIPALSEAVYSVKAKNGKNFLTGFTFSEISEEDRGAIRLFVNDLRKSTTVHDVRHFACLRRIAYLGMFPPRF